MKRKKVVKTVQPTAQRVLDIEERIAACGRGEPSHIIYIGGVIEQALKGEVGAIIKALTAGRIAMELSNNKDGRISSDRLMGRLEMAQTLWSDLENYVLDKDKLLAEKRDDKQVEQYVSSPE